MEEEGENYPMEYHIVNQNRIIVYLTPEKEAFHCIASEGWIEEVKLKIQPWRQIKVGQEKHMLFAMATQTMQDNLKTAKGYLGIADQSPLPNHINTHMDLLIWNCRVLETRNLKGIYVN
ncbi:hypothetical protein ACSBR2_012108 [Camellia fascicularis]